MEEKRKNPISSCLSCVLGPRCPCGGHAPNKKIFFSLFSVFKMQEKVRARRTRTKGKGRRWMCGNDKNPLIPFSSFFRPRVNSFRSLLLPLFCSRVPLIHPWGEVEHFSFFPLSLSYFREKGVRNIFPFSPQLLNVSFFSLTLPFPILCFVHLSRTQGLSGFFYAR